MVLDYFTNKPNDNTHIVEALKLALQGEIPENEPFGGEIDPKTDGTAAVDANNSIALETSTFNKSVIIA